MTPEEMNKAMAKRCGKFTAMLQWMAKEGRLKPHELEILNEEMRLELFSKDQEVPAISHFSEEELMSL